MFESKELLGSFFLTFVVRCGISVLCGAVIGIERERRGKPAGFRTMTLICLGSAMYMLVGEFIYQKFGSPGIDPTRIAAQVVTGIGFIGAGAIIQSRGAITGLTSAATIWVVAGVGIIIGAGFVGLGMIGTLCVLGTLVVLHKIEPKLLGACQYVESDVVFVDDGGRTRSEIVGLFNENDIDMSSFSFSRVDNKTSRLKFRFCNKHLAHHRFLTELWRTPGIIEITTQK
jgi:putative Mg2+ transporter-C (MgtC) family protein